MLYSHDPLVGRRGLAWAADAAGVVLGWPASHCHHAWDLPGSGVVRLLGYGDRRHHFAPPGVALPLLATEVADLAQVTPVHPGAADAIAQAVGYVLVHLQIGRGVHKLAL